ncbi:MAG: mechanosensitive ion channel family protein [Pseudorhodobacter sp.]|nr:MAG: mechanosensitive ion channel family protein [Pseudorhodobacter sp.]
MTGLRRLIQRIGLALALALSPVGLSPLQAQDAVRQVDETGALMPRQGPGLVESAAQTAQPQALPAEPDTTLDYAAWERLAARAEKATENRNIASDSLEAIRAQLVDWRGALSGAQSANAARIATLRTQIAALGPAPVDGATEAEEIANRRSALTEKLVELQAPGLAADEAYRRADGLISEIDRVLRERQADQLLKLWPAPINPANWPEAVIGLTDTGVRLWEEGAEKWADAKARTAFGDNVPFILLLLALAIGLLVYGRAWVQSMASRLQDRASAHGRKILALLVSLGEIIFPLIGIICAYGALVLTEMPGEVGNLVAEAAAELAVYLVLAAWLAARVFPRGLSEGSLGLPADRRAEARFYAVAMAGLFGLEGLRFAAMDAQSYSEGTTSVVSFPGLVISGLLLVRMGQLLHRHLTAERREGEAISYGKRLIGILGQGAIAVGLIGPVLAAVGYVPAAAAMIYPAMLSLFAVGLLLVLQELISDIYAAVTRAEQNATEALLPVLANFALSLASLPVFALIWGARTSDLTELWTRFREGFELGGTRISPTNFLVFAVVFGIGYMLTRMFQGGLKNSILPRTSLDQGGQNAVVSGLGYIGIFLAALIAINAAGIDLSGLAIVAGALSVGIGFGLQTIVSNFVSGIILLIERPVSEGDWIEVGTTQGIVKSISVRSTRIQTFDRSDVIVPNSDLISGRVTNWTRFNLTGRLIVPVAVPFDTDSRKVEAVLREIAEAQPLVILKPPPVVALVGFGAEVMNFEIRVILRDVNFQLQVRSDINHAIAARFAAEGIMFSYAHRDFLAKRAEAADEAEAARQAMEAVADLVAAPEPTPEHAPAKPHKTRPKDTPTP